MIEYEILKQLPGRKCPSITLTHNQTQCISLLTLKINQSNLNRRPRCPWNLLSPNQFPLPGYRVLRSSIISKLLELVFSLWSLTQLHPTYSRKISLSMHQTVWYWKTKNSGAKHASKLNGNHFWKSEECTVTKSIPANKSSVNKQYRSYSVTNPRNIRWDTSIDRRSRTKYSKFRGCKQCTKRFLSSNQKESTFIMVQNLMIWMIWCNAL